MLVFIILNKNGAMTVILGLIINGGWLTRFHGTVVRLMWVEYSFLLSAVWMIWEFYSGLKSLTDAFPRTRLGTLKATPLQPISAKD